MTIQVGGGVQFAGGAMITSWPQTYYTSTGSVSFNGTSQYLTVPANAGFNIGTGNFTLEAWIYVPNTQVGAIFATGPAASKNGFYISATGQIFYTIFNTGNYQIGTATVSANTWTHVAIVRVGSTMTAYINGTSIGNITNSSNVGDSTTVSYVGQFNSGNFFNGYISNFRFNNTAVYTANFTPSTTPLTAIAGTVLLTCQSSNTITDASTNAFTITNNGTAVATTSNPFIGGSVSFSGTNYLSLGGASQLALSSGNWTIEYWYYANSFGSAQVIYEGRPANTNGAYPTFGVSSTGALSFTTNAAEAVGTSAGQVVVNSWNHLAAVKNGSTTTVYLNGVAKGSFTDTNTYLNGGAAPYIGTNAFGVGGSNFSINGYISNLRVVKGTAVYTANFTPSTTPLTAIAGTVLLTCQLSNTITDASTNALTITNSGVTATGISPFNAVASTY